MKAYKLRLFTTAPPKLAVVPMEFIRCTSGDLKFQDASGVQYVHKSKHSNLEVFEVNDQVLCIVEENKFEDSEIIDALRNYHSKKLDKEIETLMKIKYFL